VGAGVHGLSARLARRRWRQQLTACGNAVVPHVAARLGYAIQIVASSIPHGTNHTGSIYGTPEVCR
jgi:hypothetical protein